MTRRDLLLASGVLAGLGGCASRPAVPRLGEIYNAAARRSHVDRNPIIVIPGILGSRLVEADGGRVVWGRYGGDALEHDSVEGMRALALPMSARGWPRDGVRADGALESLRVSWGFDFDFKAYRQMLAAFGVGGYLDPAHATLDEVDYGEDHFTCFQFGYDWRRSCAENAAELGRFIAEKREYVAGERRRRFGSVAPVRVDLIAHSMGGLIARYHLMYGGRALAADGRMPVTWAGARHVDKLIVVGTPNGGAVEPFQHLREGFRLSPLLSRVPAAVVGTMPSIYELLPPAGERPLIDRDSRPLDALDPELWARLGWGLMDPRQDRVLEVLMPGEPRVATRRARARAQLDKLLANARAFRRALDRPCRPPAGTELHAFIGDAVDTPSRVQIDNDGEPALIDWIAGDGAVTRRSVLRDRRGPGEEGSRLRSPIPWTGTQFVFSDHLGMTSDPAFVDNVLHLLLERP